MTDEFLVRRLLIASRGGKAGKDYQQYPPHPPLNPICHQQGPTQGTENQEQDDHSTAWHIPGGRNSILGATCQFRWRKQLRYNIYPILCHTGQWVTVKVRLHTNFFFPNYWPSVWIIHQMWDSAKRLGRLLTLFEANLTVRQLRSIPWLLMPWLLALPGHQQPWYWPFLPSGPVM